MYTPPQAVQPSEILAGCVAIYRDIWKNPKKDILLLEQEVEQGEITFFPAVKYDGTMDDQRSNYTLNLDVEQNSNDFAKILYLKALNSTHAALQSYQSKFKIIETLAIAEPFSLLRYTEGQEFKEHHDGGTETGRSVSALIYLNNDFTGGHLEFVNFGVTVQPEPGMLLLFPSNYAYEHVAYPVETGTKYAIATFILDRFE
jgi:predicted 2-oxoglutarate/Fe(II)-dependent dioxygenase YbiX